MTGPRAHTGEQERTILVCDDEASLRELVRAILSDGYRFAEAEDGEEALELARAIQPDLVIIDIMLPGRSGLEVVSELRRDTTLHRTPVVVVTAWSHAESSARRAGAAGFLEKPFDPEDLQRMVDELLAA